MTGMSSLLLHQRRACPTRFGRPGTWQRVSWVGRIDLWSSSSPSTPTTRLYSNILPSTVVAFAASPSLTFALTSSVSLASPSGHSTLKPRHLLREPRGRDTRWELCFCSRQRPIGTGINV